MSKSQGRLSSCPIFMKEDEIMPPHQIFGLSWAEIASIFGVLGLVYGGARSLLKTLRSSIMDPLNSQMDRLARSIDELTKNSLMEHHSFDDRLDRHDIRLGVHDSEIGTLYHEVGLPRHKRRKEDNE